MHDEPLVLRTYSMNSDLFCTVPVPHLQPDLHLPRPLTALLQLNHVTQPRPPCDLPVSAAHGQLDRLPSHVANGPHLGCPQARRRPLPARLRRQGRGDGQSCCKPVPLRAKEPPEHLGACTSSAPLSARGITGCCPSTRTQLPAFLLTSLIGGLVFPRVAVGLSVWLVGR